MKEKTGFIVTMGQTSSIDKNLINNLLKLINCLLAIVSKSKALLSVLQIRTIFERTRLEILT